MRAAVLLLTGLALTATPALAQRGGDRRGGSPRSGAAVRPRGPERQRSSPIVGRAVPRGSVGRRTGRSSVVTVVPYSPYRYRSGGRLGFSYGYGWPYGYSGYGYGAYGYDPYGYGYGRPPGYVAVVPGRVSGGVRIQGAPRQAEVIADGYYVGIVDDFDGVFQRLELEPGPHRIEIRAPGYAPAAFDVRILPGATITYHAALAAGRP